MSALTADKRHVIERDVRCTECGKLLTKISFYVSLPEQHNYGDGLSISDFFPAIEIKIGLETKCNRCKKMDHKLTVI